MPARDSHRLISSGADRPQSRAQRGTIDRRLRIAIAVLSLIGIGIGGYLTYVHYADLHVLCLSNGGCETVQSSRYSNLAGVPVAVVGLAGYISILITVLFRGDAARTAGFGLALVGFLFSMYLTYREIFTIKAICQWCLGSAVLMTLLAILTTIRVLRVEPEAADSQPGTRPSRQRGGSFAESLRTGLARPGVGVCASRCAQQTTERRERRSRYGRKSLPLRTTRSSCGGRCRNPAMRTSPVPAAMSSRPASFLGRVPL